LSVDALEIPSFLFSLCEEGINFPRTTGGSKSGFLRSVLSLFFISSFDQYLVTSFCLKIYFLSPTSSSGVFKISSQFLPLLDISSPNISDFKSITSEVSSFSSSVCGGV